MHAAARWTDLGWAAREQEQLWGRSWLLAEHSRRLSRPGDFSVLDIGPRSAFVVRGEDQSLRAFANACPHRGTRLLDDLGCAMRLQCPYHAWTYALDGTLVMAPGVVSTPDVRLVSLPVAERFGFAWVAFSTEAEPIDAFLEPLAEDFERQGVERLAINLEMTIELACNWKLSTEVHTETLHVPWVHPEIARSVDWRHARHTRLGPHARMELDMTEGPGANVVLYVFPNVHFNFSPSHSFLLRHRPVADRADRTHVDHLVLGRGVSAAPVGLAERRWVTPDKAAAGSVLLQDFQMAERLQRGLATGAIAEPLFTEAETPLAWMRAELDRRMGR